MSAPELLSLVLALRPLSAPPAERPLPAWWGGAAHRLALAALQQADPALAAQTHDQPGLRPLSASSLLGRMPQRRPDPAVAYALRLTGLTERVSAALLQSIQPGGLLAPGQPVELDYLPFQVEAAHTAPEEHPWAGSASYQALTGQHLLGGEPGRKIRLRFSSPTGFHSAEKHQPFPLPELVFGSLLERWNSFAPLAFPAEARRYALECLAVSHYRLRTRSTPVKEGGLRVGCIGEVTYTALTYDRYWLGILHTLAAYAFYSGVGISTGMGFGQAVRIEPEAPRSEEESAE